MQVHQRWERPTDESDLRVEFLFFVHRDGSISHLQVVETSGSFAFDLNALAAIEEAAAAGAFGPLPGSYEADVLPVNFFIDPEKKQ